MENSAAPLIGLFAAIVILLVVFLICREIVCWYWKINEAIGLLRDIRTELMKQNGSSSEQSTLRQRISPNSP